MIDMFKQITFDLPSLLYGGNIVSSSETIQEGIEPQHLLPTGTDIKNQWKYTLIPPYTPTWHARRIIYISYFTFHI
jgi:hypothetical protein